MRKTGPNHPRRSCTGEQFCRLDVGNVPAAPADAAFQESRVRAGLEHSLVVVALDDDGVQRRDQVGQAVEDVARRIDKDR